MKNLVIAFLLLFIIACTPAKQKTEETQDNTPSLPYIITDSCEIAGLKISLREHGKGDSMSIHVDGSEGEIAGNYKLTPPCYFLRINGQIQSYSYEDKMIDHVIILVGNISSDETKKRLGVSSELICGDKIQGLLIKKQRLSFTDSILSGGITCKDSGTDEKNFWILAH